VAWSSLYYRNCTSLIAWPLSVIIRRRRASEDQDSGVHAMSWTLRGIFSPPGIRRHDILPYSIQLDTWLLAHLEKSGRKMVRDLICAACIARIRVERG
jgi:hypothetical protein